jgi:hypothetical protein
VETKEESGEDDSDSSNSQNYQDTIKKLKKEVDYTDNKGTPSKKPIKTSEK